MRFAIVLCGFILLSAVGYTQQVSPEKKANMPTALNEISGLFFWNGKLYGHNDGGNTPDLFEIDSATGVINKRITLAVPYTGTDDWEDVTQDETYIYIGNFGNNANGSRRDLKFYRVPKQPIADITGTTGTIAANQIDEIKFSYEDQHTFCPDDFACSANDTKFDCEAVFYDEGMLHLFTKDWVTLKTVHYTVPAVPGTHMALKKEEFDTNGLLITGAAKISSKTIALLGYQKPTQDQILANNGLYCKLWVIMGFTDMNNVFTTATETRNVTLGKFLSIPTFPNFFSTEGLGQQEAIALVDGTRVFIAGERFTRSQSIFSWDIPAQLYAVELASVIPQNMILSNGISNFALKTSPGAVLLNWVYAGSGAAFFEIEVSSTGNNADFKTVGKVNTSSTYPFEYSFTDNSISTSSKLYYRIKANMHDGRIVFSETLTAINSSNINFTLSVYPSPFTDKLMLNFSNNVRQQMSVTVIDVYGRTVMVKSLEIEKGNYNITLDGLGNLGNGVYFLNCRTKDGLLVKKIVKQ